MAELTSEDLKSIAEQIISLTKKGHSDSEIDQGLAKYYPELLSKDSYDKHGGYVIGGAYSEYLKQVEREKTPRGSKRYFTNLGNNWMDTATFGMGKRVVALLGSVIYDQPYDLLMDSLDKEEERFNETYPVDSTVSMLAGGISPVPMGVANVGYNLIAKSPFIGKLLAPKAGQVIANIARESAKSVPVSMAESALYTAGTSRDVDEFKQRVIPEALATGIGSAGLTPLMMAAGNAGTTAFRKGKQVLSGEKNPRGVTMADDDRALSIMSKNLKDGGFTPEQIAAEIERIRKIDPELAEKLLMMDVAGDPFISSTMGAMGTSGKAQKVGVDNIRPFFRDQVERLKTYSANKLLKAPSVAKFRAENTAKRRSAGKLYDKLWFNKKGKRVNPVSPTKKVKVNYEEGEELLSLAEILDPRKPSVKAAMNAAQTLADETRTIIPPPSASGFDAQHLHYIKMGYDQVLTQFGEQGLSGSMRFQAKKNLKALNTFMDQNIKGYKNARAKYAEPVSENRAFTEGYTSMKNSTNLESVPELIETKIKDFSVPEQEAYKAGAAKYMEQFIEQGMDPLSVTNKARKLSQIALIKRVKAIWGEETGGQYARYMEQHAKMLEKRGIVSPRSGSMTFPREEAQGQFRFDDGSSTVPLSAREGVSSVLSGGADPNATRAMSQGAAEAASPRLTLPGPENIMKNQKDIAAWQRLQSLKDKAEYGRRGSVPGLLNPVAGDAGQFMGIQ